MRQCRSVFSFDVVSGDDLADAAAVATELRCKTTLTAAVVAKLADLVESSSIRPDFKPGRLYRISVALEEMDDTAGDIAP